MVDEGARLFQRRCHRVQCGRWLLRQVGLHQPGDLFLAIHQNGQWRHLWRAGRVGRLPTSDQIDEHYLYAKGGFGKVTLVADDAAHYNLHSEAPGRGFDNYNDPSYVTTYGG